MATLIRRAVLGLFGSEGDVVREREVQVMVTATAVLVTGQFLVSPLISDLAGIFSVSEARGGLIMIAFTAPPIVFIPIFGVIADRVGRKRVLVPGILLFGVAGGLIAVSPSFNVMIGLRILQGIGFAAAVPLTVALFGDLYEGSREATAQSLRAVSIYSMNMVAPLVAGAIFVSGWFYPFLLYFLAIPVAVWAWISLPSVKPDHKGSLNQYFGDLFSLFRMPVMGLVLVSFVFRFSVFFGFLTYVSVLATRDIGLAVVAAGGVVSVKGLVSLISATQGGRLTARYDPAVVLTIGFTGSGIGLILMGVFPTETVLLTGTALVGFGDGIINPVQKSLVNELSPDRLRAGAISAATTFQNLGMVVGPGLMGFVLAVTNTRVAFVTLGVVAGFGGAVLLTIVWWLNR